MAILSAYYRWGSDMLAWILCKIWRSKDHWKVQLHAIWNLMNVVFWTRRQRWSSAQQFTTREVFLIVFTLIFGVLSRLYHLEAIDILSLLLMIVLDIFGYTLWDKNLKSEVCSWSERSWWRISLVGNSRCFNLIMLGSTRISSYNLIKIMVWRCTSQFRKMGLPRR